MPNTGVLMRNFRYIYSELVILPAADQTMLKFTDDGETWVKHKYIQASSGRELEVVVTLYCCVTFDVWSELVPEVCSFYLRIEAIDNYE
jgi:hypothetical protein